MKCLIWNRLLQQQSIPQPSNLTPQTSVAPGSIEYERYLVALANRPCSVEACPCSGEIDIHDDEPGPLGEDCAYRAICIIGDAHNRVAQHLDLKR